MTKWLQLEECSQSDPTHPLEESNGKGLCKLGIVPQSVFRILFSPQQTLYTKGLRELLLQQQKL